MEKHITKCPEHSYWSTEKAVMCMCEGERKIKPVLFQSHQQSTDENALCYENVNSRATFYQCPMIGLFGLLTQYAAHEYVPKYFMN